MPITLMETRAHSLIDFLLTLLGNVLSMAVTTSRSSTPHMFLRVPMRLKASFKPDFPTVDSAW